MKKRLTPFFLFLILASSVLAGVPMHSGEMSRKTMDCCDKARENSNSPHADAARLCCALNCSESVPTQSGISFNLSPSGVITSESIAEQIAALFPASQSHISPVRRNSREILPATPQHKYIQNHSFLI